MFIAEASPTDAEVFAIAIWFAIPFLICGTMWTHAAMKMARGQPLLEFQPRRRVPWGLFDLLLVFLLLLCAMAAVRWAVAALGTAEVDTPAEELSPQDMALRLFAGSLAMLLGCGGAVLVLRFRTGATWTDIGFRLRQFASDVRIGGAAFLMLAPPMYVLQLVLTQFWFKSEHPLQTMMLKQANPTVLATAIFTAVIVAPLTEEIFFRTIFQGWLEKASLLLFNLFGFRGEKSPSTPEEMERDVSGLLMGDLATLPPIPARPAEADQDNLHLTTQADAAPARPIDPEIRNAEFPNLLAAFLPIAISAEVFALLHASHGPDPIALLFLAIGLGYIYQRTHRITPCIVLHFLVNGFSTLMLLIFLLSGAKPP